MRCLRFYNNIYIKCLEKKCCYRYFFIVVKKEEEEGRQSGIELELGSDSVVSVKVWEVNPIDLVLILHLQNLKG